MELPRFHRVRANVCQAVDLTRRHRPGFRAHPQGLLRQCHGCCRKREYGLSPKMKG
jgi:hypothetical protein